MKLWSARGNVVSSVYTAGAVGLLVREALTDNVCLAFSFLVHTGELHIIIFKEKESNKTHTCH